MKTNNIVIKTDSFYNKVMVKIDKDQYERIFERREKGESVQSIARSYDVKSNAIYRILERYEIEKDEEIRNFKDNLNRAKNLYKIKNIAEKNGIELEGLKKGVNSLVKSLSIASNIDEIEKDNEYLEIVERNKNKKIEEECMLELKEELNLLKEELKKFSMKIENIEKGVKSLTDVSIKERQKHQKEIEKIQKEIKQNQKEKEKQSQLEEQFRKIQKEIEKIQEDIKDLHSEIEELPELPNFLRPK